RGTFISARSRRSGISARFSRANGNVHGRRSSGSPHGRARSWSANLSSRVVSLLQLRIAATSQASFLPPRWPPLIVRICAPELRTSRTHVRWLGLLEYEEKSGSG